MRIYVCVKHVPDTAASIKPAGGAGFDEAAVKFVMNPYDEYAVEQAVRLVESCGGEVVAVTVGQEAAAATLRAAMAMGAARGILVAVDRQFLDSAATARALAAAIARDGRPDLIFTGKGAVDTEGFQTAYRLAAELGLPVASEVLKMELAEGRAVVEREIGGGAREVLEAPLPCVIGATKGLNEPRYPKFPDIMKAKKKEVRQLTLADLGLSAAGAAEIVALEKVPERTGARMIPGAPREAARELVRILREEEKVI
jgi:electron transfer flavoprotein beta subunit